MTKLNEQTGCIEWIGCKDEAGYGQLKRNKISYNAHRYIYELYKGPVGNLNVLHDCDNRCCVNLEHLFAGTQADNMRDMYAKGRRELPIGELHGGAKITEKEVKIIRALSPILIQRKIGRLFGITRANVGCIIRRESWSHIPELPEEEAAELRKQYFSRI